MKIEIFTTQNKHIASAKFALVGTDVSKIRGLYPDYNRSSCCINDDNQYSFSELDLPKNTAVVYDFTITINRDDNNMHVLAYQIKSRQKERILSINTEVNINKYFIEVFRDIIGTHMLDNYKWDLYKMYLRDNDIIYDAITKAFNKATNVK